MSINSYRALYLSLIMTYNMVSVHSQTIINCDDTTDCSNEVITCEEGSDCTITCTGTDRKNCQCATFICPSGPYDCNLSCFQESKPEQCVGAIVDASQTNFGNLVVDIFGVNMAQKARFIAPTNGNTTINAGGYGVLGGRTVVDASHTISGNLDIKYNDAHHSGKTDWKYSGMKVYCPMSGHCILDAGVGFAACRGCEIYSQPTTSLVSVTAVGGVALQRADIYCPPKSGSEKTCKITTTGSYGNAFDDMNIFAAESFTNVKVSASYSGVGDPIMHCMSDYSESCDVERISNTVWQCEDAMSSCRDWTYDPAYVTTVAPTEPSTTVEMTTTDARCFRDPTTTDGILYTTNLIQTSSVTSQNERSNSISTLTIGIIAGLVLAVVAAVIFCRKSNKAAFRPKKQTPVPVASTAPHASVQVYPTTQTAPTAAALPAPAYPYQTASPNVRVMVVPANVNTVPPGQVYPILQPGAINRISLPSSATSYQTVAQNSPVTPVTSASQNSPITPASQNLPVTPYI
eukprot:973340_1